MIKKLPDTKEPRRAIIPENSKRIKDMGRDNTFGKVDSIIQGSGIMD